jgi:hypothetical protein
MSYDFDTSLPAYTEAKQTADTCRQMVFAAIRNLGPCTDKMIAAYLGWEINKTVPRRHELVEKGIIESAFKKIDNESNRKVNWWQEKKIILSGEQSKLF